MAGWKLHVRAPDFTLVDQGGHPISLGEFRGRVVLLAFVDSECTTICPLTTQSMLEALRLLGPVAGQVELVGVDANPLAIAVADVQSYTAAHGLVGRWHFLTGSLAQLKGVWSAYHILARVVDGQIDHTPALYVIDRQGWERWVYLTPMEYAAIDQEAEILAGDVSNLLPSHPRVLRAPSPTLRITSLDQAVSLPALAGKDRQVELCPGRSRLLAFYASWAPGAEEDLRQLNQYVVDAGRDDLPPLTAIDVATTEPSTAAASQFLGQVGFLLYPVAEDTGGQVADLYLVQDLPWLALIGRSGHVIWSHDGWVAVPQLEVAVRRALGRGGGGFRRCCPGQGR